MSPYKKDCGGNRGGETDRRGQTDTKNHTSMFSKASSESNGKLSSGSFSYEILDCLEFGAHTQPLGGPDGAVLIGL